MTADLRCLAVPRRSRLALTRAELSRACARTQANKYCARLALCWPENRAGTHSGYAYVHNTLPEARRDRNSGMVVDRFVGGGGRIKSQRSSFGRRLRQSGYVEISRGDTAEKRRRSCRGTELQSMQNDSCRSAESKCLLLLLLLLVDT